MVNISSVGVIGLDVVGSTVARRLLDGGLEVTAHDPDPWVVATMTPAGAIPARIPADAAEPADVVFVHVPDESGVDEVLFDCGGVGETLRDGGFVVAASPIGAAFLLSAAEQLAALRLNLVEAWFTGLSGGIPDTVLVGCAPGELEALTPVLRTIAANVEALNAATANIAPEKLRMHVCWGNYEGPHDFDIPLEKIIDVILSARPATILFEGANPRHEHEWVVWRDAKLPEDKILAPGLIDSCSNYLETPELIAQRIERYASFVGKDRVIASSDCGFGTFAGYGKIDPAVAWKKLAALREGADIADARIG